MAGNKRRSLGWAWPACGRVEERQTSRLESSRRLELELELALGRWRVSIHSIRADRPVTRSRLESPVVRVMSLGPSPTRYLESTCYWSRGVRGTAQIEARVALPMMGAEGRLKGGSRVYIAVCQIANVCRSRKQRLDSEEMSIAGR